jgi:hypothetical protein
MILAQEFWNIRYGLVSRLWVPEGGGAKQLLGSCYYTTLYYSYVLYLLYYLRSLASTSWLQIIYVEDR